MSVELLIGMIASGKSTYARGRARKGALVVSHDGLTEMLHAEYRYQSGLRKLYRQMEELLVLTALEEGYPVVIDRTHLTRESRQRWLRFAYQVFGKPAVTAVVFPVEPAHAHARRRFESDPRGRTLEEWRQVAEHHAEQARAEPLDWRNEGFAAVRHYSHGPGPAAGPGAPPPPPRPAVAAPSVN